MSLSRKFSLLLCAASLSASVATQAAEYVIDGTDAGMHTAVNFSASHMGISSLWGRFNDVTGHFSYDAKDIGAASITINIDPASIDTNHSARDEHLSSSDYLDVAKFPKAGFVSTSIRDMGMGKLHITGDLSLHGVTKSISFDATRTGEGETPFGDYRVGFDAEAVVDVSEFGISLGGSNDVTFALAIEGIRQ